MKVKTRSKVFEKSCVCDSWLSHWEKCSGLRADFCSAKNCRKRDLIGVHVCCVSAKEELHYIIPLCEGSHAKLPEIDIYEGTRLIVYDEKESVCEKIFNGELQY